MICCVEKWCILALSVIMLGCSVPAEPEVLCHSAPACDLKLLVDGKQFVDSLVSLIDRADSSIYIEIYEFRSDSVGKAVMSHLLSKAREGVRVDLVLDGWGSKDQWEADTLKGINITEWDRFDFPYLNHVRHRNHRKVVVVDGCKCMVGCTNIADYYISGLPELGCWHDMTLMFPAGSQQVIKGEGEILQRWISLLDSAKEYVNIINPYIAPPASLEDAISAAVKRNVKVTFLFSEKGDIDSYFKCSKSFLSRMGTLGAGVMVYPSGFHHTKAMSVDGRVLFIGSANMTHRALKRNLEENVLVSDSSTVAEFDSKFAEYVEVSYPLGPGAVSFSDRLYDIFSWLIID